MMAGNNTEPLLQTFWLPRNSQEEASGTFLGWILFGAVTLFVIFLVITFG
ncbi:MAG: hypothetical protein GX750_02170 [Clostridia bacterium]|nr:hypothetical protein [Clostridia bacterium]